LKHFSIVMLMLFLTYPVFAQKIAVMDLKPLGYFDKDEIQVLSERFRSEIVKTKKYEVMERQDLMDLDRELALQLSSGFDANVVAQAGKKSGAQFVILGSLGKIGAQYTIDVKMVNCETGRIEESIAEDYKGSKEGLIAVMHSIAFKMAGIQEKKSTWKWIAAGAVGVGSAVVIMLIKGQAATPGGLPAPPNPPSVPW